MGQRPESRSVEREIFYGIFGSFCASLLKKNGESSLNVFPKPNKSRGNSRLFSLLSVYDSSACSGVLCFLGCFFPIFRILRMVGLSTMLTNSSNTKLRPTKNTIM